jgi:hypothetical protein
LASLATNRIWIISAGPLNSTATHLSRVLPA